MEVKPGEEAVSVNVNWTVEKFVEGEKTKKEERGKTKSSKGKPTAKKASKPAKRKKK